ncbi:putative Cyclin-dependent kinase D-1 [Hypsibius exemplaris]|uniref:Cyclin-dependent kinase D-1 n=1 Tax=Hypsibius exemplaris TaxID=2072580 RepID=A0A1W0WTC4_HYPEX|nr:putative Cyclin-dependent kinase D-1 [Hypsibius exemplaris]
MATISKPDCCTTGNEQLLDRLAISENAPDEYSDRSLMDDSFYDGVDPSRFLKLDRLGEGQYATVYRAKSLTENNKIVAIKYLRLLTGPETLHLTGKTDLHEVEILSRLNHPNVVRFIDYFSEGRQKAVVLEYMDYSLDILLKDIPRYPVSLPQVIHYVGNILRGLAYLHGQKVTHRDLKPNNILVNKAGEVKIGDFGCSRRLEGDARYSRQFACRAYRPPEIILSTKVYNQTVDMWALGCIVAEFYKEGPLFFGASDIEQICKISKTLGSPKPEDYRKDQISGIHLNSFQYPRKSILEVIPTVHLVMATFMEHCLTYDIDVRWTSQAGLAYLMAEEKKYPPCLPHQLLTPLSQSARRSSKRKYFFDTDTSSSGGGSSDLMEAPNSDESNSNEVTTAAAATSASCSFQSPSPIRSVRDRRTFPQPNFSPATSARKKLCF